MLVNMQDCKHKRIELGLSQESIAKAISINQSNLSVYENVNSAPYEVFIKYRDFLYDYEAGKIELQVKPRNYPASRIYKGSEDFFRHCVSEDHMADLRRFRKLLKLSSNEVSKSIGLTGSQYLHSEHFRRNMTFKEYEAAAAFMISTLLRRVLGQDYRDKENNENNGNNEAVK